MSEKMDERRKWKRDGGQPVRPKIFSFRPNNISTPLAIRYTPDTKTNNPKRLYTPSLKRCFPNQGPHLGLQHNTEYLHFQAKS